MGDASTAGNSEVLWPTGVILVAMVAFACAYVNSPSVSYFGTVEIKNADYRLDSERSICLALRSFAVMLSAGVLPQALSLVSEAVDNAHMGAKSNIRRTIERGEICLVPHDVKTAPLVLQMIVVGEETGRSDALKRSLIIMNEKRITI